MRRPSLRLALGAAALFAALLAAAPPAPAASFVVPSGATPTLQAAVAAAAASADASNLITIVQSPIFTTARVLIDSDFGPGHRLVIRPSAALPRGRAIVASQNGSQPIVELSVAGGVTLQDLDLLRYSTNNADLVVMTNPTQVLIERCRIGSVWSSVGSDGWSNVAMSYPVEVTVRNCMLFSALYGNFSYGLRASIGDDTNSLFLYHNTITDYDLYGIEISDAIPLSELALHNNVCVNHPDAVVEPFAFHSAVALGVTLATSHNTAYAALANAEVFAAGQRVSGLGGVGWRRLPRTDAAASFVQMPWDMTSPLDPNRNQRFLCLEPNGPLHDDVADFGVKLSEGSPDAIDHAVTDDWERNPRPSGNTSHTDRGADQVEIGTTGVEPLAGDDGALRLAPAANPAREGRLRYTAGASGELLVEVLDVAGRRVHREVRRVTGGDAGAIDWGAPPAAGVFVYRVTLVPDDGPAVTRSGRVVLLR
jgi:hypothetical protein